jgi:hypothetical protein
LELARSAVFALVLSSADAGALLGDPGRMFLPSVRPGVIVSAPPDGSAPDIDVRNGQ